MNAKYTYFEDRIQQTFEQRRFTQLRCIIPHELKPTGTHDFTSHDFLGLSTHDFVKKQSIKAVLQWGAGSTASRRINAHIDFQQKIERKLAEALGQEETLLFPSSMQAHASFLPTLVNKNTVVFIDRFASPFLYQTLQPLTAKILRFEHNNIHDLERQLQNHSTLSAHQKIIITESLFTASGDYAPLRGLIDLATNQNALLYIDDSNTMGVKGHNGLGHCSGRRGIDCIVGSFGKAAGCFGAYGALPSLLKEYITSLSPSISAMPPLPPAVLGAIDASLTLIPDMHHERKLLEDLCEYARSSLYKHGLEYDNSSSHIIPILFENDELKNKMGDFLEERSIYLQRSQKKNNEKSSLRILISSWHSKEDIDTLCDTLEQGVKEIGISKPSLAAAYVT